MRPRAGIVVSIDKARAAQAGLVRAAVLTHLDELYRFALRLTHDAEQAGELVQESVLRALENENTEMREPRGWLFQTLYHTFISHCRARLRRQTLGENSSLLQPEDRVGGLPAVIAIEDVRTAVERLPEDFRTVVWLSDAEQFRLREIAEILGCPLGTVASRVARGRQELRRLLSAYGPPEEK